MASPGIFDALIIGQGLAGSALAFQLVQDEKKVLVVDQAEMNTSSNVAAGLFNPVTGKLMAKTWMADEIFPFLDSFYSSVEKVTGATFFHPMPIYRPFNSVAEQNDWIARGDGSSIRHYVGQIFSEPRYPKTLNDPFGGLVLTRCGYLNVRVYIDAVRTFLYKNSRCEYREEHFTAEKLIVGSEGVRYGDCEARLVVFCEGERVTENPWFDWLPVRLLKGELLTVEGKFLTDTIVNRGVYMLPAGQDGQFRVGATYERDFAEGGITKSGRMELESRLRALVKGPFKVTGHFAGVRTTTPDRRPVMGAHPEFSNLVIFNGLGTKGVSLSPYFSAELVRWFKNEAQLNNAVNISRYKSLYWNSR